MTEIPEYCDEYLEMKYPGRLSELGETQLWPALLARLSVETEEEVRAELSARTERLNERKKEHLESLDHSILDALGLSVEEVLSLKREKVRREASGRVRHHITSDMRTVFASFLSSEADGHTYAQAVNRAMRSGHSVTEKSVRRWLTNLIKFGVCTIPPATRRKG